MTALTHGVRDTLADEIVSEHPNAAEAFKAAAERGGPERGFIVEPLRPIIPKAPPPRVPPRPQGITIELSVKKTEPPATPPHDAEGPGLFD